MKNNKKLLAVLSVPAIASLLAVAVTTPVKAADRDFTDNSVSPAITYSYDDYTSSDEKFDSLIDAVYAHPSNFLYEMGGKHYQYSAFFDTYKAAKKPGVTAAQAYKIALDTTPVVTLVNVTSVDTVKDVLVENGTTADKLGLPTTVAVTLSDGTKDAANVAWDTTKFDGTKAGDQTINGTLTAPAGKAWSLTDAQKTVSVKVTVKAAKTALTSVNAINASNVQVVGFASTVKEADLTGKTVTLSDGTNTLTATYKASSLTTDGKATFALASDKTLVDAAKYTVTSDWASFTTDSFVAKIATAYANSFDKVTTNVIAANGAKIYFAPKNQYGEAISITNTDLTNVKLVATLNGMPLSAEAVVSAEPTGKALVTINSTRALKENDVLNIELDTYDKAPAATDAKVIAKSSASYTVVKGDAATATSVAGVSAKYHLSPLTGHKDGDAASEVLPNDKVTLTADVRDQYNNPVTSASEGTSLVRWVVTSGSDLVSIDKLNNGTIDTNGNNVDFTANGAGTFTVDAYNLANGSKATYTVTIGATKLGTLTEKTESVAPAYNQEKITPFKIAQNPGAILTADMIKFNVVARTTGLTANDVTVTTSVRDKDDVTDQSKKKGDILINVTTAKAGTFEITPYVGASFDDTNAVKANTFTITTTANPSITAIDAITVPTLKLGTPVKQNVVVRNTHGETVNVASNKLNVNVYKNGVAVSQDATTPDLKVEKLDVAGNVAKEATTVKQIKLTANVEGNYVVRLSVDGTSVLSDIAVTAQKTSIASINAGDDITTGIIAGQKNGNPADVTYRVLTVKDNTGDTVIPDLGSELGKLKVSVKNQDTTDVTTIAPTATLVYYKTVDGKITEVTDKADAEGIAIKIDANSATTPTDADKTVVVTVDNNGKTADGTLVADTLNVNVQQIRKVKTLTANQKTLSIGLNGTAKVDVVTKDQYGDFCAVNPMLLGVNSADSSVANQDGAIYMVDADGNVTTDLTKAVAYEYQVKGYKTGSTSIDVKYGTTLKDTVSVNVAPAATLVSSIKLVNDNLKADGTYGYKIPNNNQKAVIFTVKALDASGNAVAIDPTNILWTSSDSSVATVKDGVVATTDVTEDKQVTITADVFGVKKSVTLTVSKDGSALVNGTVALTKAGDITDLSKIDADASKDGIQIALDGKVDDGEDKDGAITLTFAGKDQFGTNVGINKSTDAVISYDTEVATIDLDKDNSKVTITPVAVGSTKVRLTVGTQDIIVDVNVSDKAVVEQAAKHIGSVSTAAVKVTTDGSIITATRVNQEDKTTTLDSLLTVQTLVDNNLVPTSVTINDIQYTDVLKNIDAIKTQIAKLADPTGATDYAHVTLEQLANKPITITANGTTMTLVVQ